MSDLKSAIINELEQFEISGDETVTYYRDIEQLESKVNDAIAKVEAYLNKFDPWELYAYLAKPDSSKSTELIKEWDVDYESTISCLECLHLMMEDNLPYMIACGMLGHGRGLWELFDEFPCLNTLV